MGKINVVASTSDHFWHVVTFDDATVDGSAVTAAGATCKVFAGDSFCDTAACTCDHDVAEESYDLMVDNMVLANSDADDVSFDDRLMRLHQITCGN